MRPLRLNLVLPVLLTAAGVWVLVGCVYIPGSKTLSGKNVAASVGPALSRKPVRVSHSTTSDVVRVLGEPPHATSDRRVFAYPWTFRRGYDVYPLCFSAYPVQSARTLVLRFDERRVLRSFELLSNDAPGGVFGPLNATPELPVEIWDERVAKARRIKAAMDAAKRPSTAPTTQPED